jgi:hypothetical protein
MLRSFKSLHDLTGASALVLAMILVGMHTGQAQPESPRPVGTIRGKITIPAYDELTE